MRINLPSSRGPFDIVGDVHGCLHELLALLAVLGYRVQSNQDSFAVAPPPGRTLAFVGDLVNRGPDSAGVLKLVMHMQAQGHAFSVAGNQDMKLAGALRGNTVQPTPGLARSLHQFASAAEDLRRATLAFLDALPAHCVLDHGNLVIAHAGLPERMHGSASARARACALAGETTGEMDEFGLQVRLDWAADYRGRALVVYGHTPVIVPLWLNNTVNIDTGCVYGGHLTALRYPEREIVQVPARDLYFPSRRRFPPNPSLAQSARP